ncbi:MAG: DUF1016 domain-containing protein [Spirulina sp. SIO3F2]|nr:DUF1016 domain-containing protein [Spirulina sp. SIO3F2]
MLHSRRTGAAYGSDQLDVCRKSSVNSALELYCDALRHELSWTHYRLLLRVDNLEARLWYSQEAAAQSEITCVLERQIGLLYYGRLLASS